MSKEIVKILNITKIFNLKGKNKSIKALNNINFSVNKGEIFGLLGPNGAGKTTLIQILSTLLHPTSGYALIDGYDILKNPLKAKEKIALMLGKKMLYYRITGYDNLKFFCKIYKVPHNKERIYKSAKFFGLEEWLNQYVEKYSEGMKMKLALCRTFLLNRPILFLDEPTQGLDVKLKIEIVEKIKELNKTIIITSHDMGVIEKLCNRVAFINKGELVKIVKKEDIKKFEEKEIKINLFLNHTNKEDLIYDLKDQNFLTDINKTEKGILISLANRKYYKDLFGILSNYHILKITEQETTLEEIFLKLNR